MCSIRSRSCVQSVGDIQKISDSIKPRFVFFAPWSMLYLKGFSKRYGFAVFFAPLTLWRTNEHFFGIPEWQFVKLSWGRILCCWQWRAVQGWAQTGPSLERCIFHMSRSKECEGSPPLCQSPTKVQVQCMLIFTGLLFFFFISAVSDDQTGCHQSTASSATMKQESSYLSLPTVTFKVMGRERAC